MPLRELFCDHTTGDAIAGVAGGIGLHIVGFRVDYDRRPAIAEERVGVRAEVYVFILQFRVGLAFGVYREVQHVAGVMAFGALQAVLLALGVKVRTCGFKIRPIALRRLMKVDAVLAGRKIVQVKLDGDP